MKQNQNQQQLQWNQNYLSFVRLTLLFVWNISTTIIRMRRFVIKCYPHNTDRESIGWLYGLRHISRSQHMRCSLSHSVHTSLAGCQMLLSLFRSTVFRFQQTSSHCQYLYLHTCGWKRTLTFVSFWRTVDFQTETHITTTVTFAIECFSCIALLVSGYSPLNVFL